MRLTLPIPKFWKLSKVEIDTDLDLKQKNIQNIGYIKPTQIHNVGDPIVVECIGEEDYTLIKADAAQRDYNLSANVEQTEFNFGTYDTYTEVGVATGIKYQVQAQAPSAIVVHFRLYEDGEMIKDVAQEISTLTTIVGETNTAKTSANYELRIMSEADGDVSVWSRNLYFKKKYVAVKI